MAGKTTKKVRFYEETTERSADPEEVQKQRDPTARIKDLEAQVLDLEMTIQALTEKVNMQIEKGNEKDALCEAGAETIEKLKKFNEDLLAHQEVCCKKHKMLQKQNHILKHTIHELTRDSRDYK